MNAHTPNEPGSGETVALPVVSVELDAGPLDMRFGYVPKGEPTYGDVPSDLGACPDEGSAELAGALMIQVGNWRSFTVEKRYYEVAQSGSQRARD